MYFIAVKLIHYASVKCTDSVIGYEPIVATVYIGEGNNTLTRFRCMLCVCFTSSLHLLVHLHGTVPMGPSCNNDKFQWVYINKFCLYYITRAYVHSKCKQPHCACRRVHGRIYREGLRDDE